MKHIWICTFAFVLIFATSYADLKQSAVEYLGTGNKTARLFFEKNNDSAMEAMLLGGFKPLQILRQGTNVFALYKDQFGRVRAHKFTGLVGFDRWDFPDGLYWAKFREGIMFQIDEIISKHGVSKNDGRFSIFWEEVK